MSNYPNMSYCMFNNTRLAMDQLIGFFDDCDDNLQETLEVSEGELQSMEELESLCLIYLNKVKQFNRQRVEANKIFDEMLEDQDNYDMINSDGKVIGSFRA